jgi:hypothetical protein
VFLLELSPLALVAEALAHLGLHLAWIAVSAVRPTFGLHHATFITL